MAELQTRLLEEALELTEEDRVKLAGLLLDSLDAEEGEGVEAAWVSEIKTRLAALDEGRSETIIRFHPEALREAENALNWIEIIALMHQKKRPGYWGGRI